MVHLFKVPPEVTGDNIIASYFWVGNSFASVKLKCCRKQCHCTVWPPIHPWSAPATIRNILADSMHDIQLSSLCTGGRILQTSEATATTADIPQVRIQQLWFSYRVPLYSHSQMDCCTKLYKIILNFAFIWCRNLHLYGSIKIFVVEESINLFPC